MIGMSSSSMRDILFQQVVPTVGVVTGTFMSFAPFRAVLKASRDGSLGDLNATPFVFMLGNCCGWLAYAFLIQNMFVFLPNAPGFILAIWLNIIAIKLQYENYRSNELQHKIIDALTEHAQKTNHKTLHKREVSNLVESVVLDEAFLTDLLAPESTAPVIVSDDEEEEVSTFSHNRSSTTYSSIVLVDGNEHAQHTKKKDLLKNNDDHDGATDDEVNKDSGAAGQILDYASFIWDIVAQKSPAPASHELMVVAISTFWLVLISIAGMGQSILSVSSRALIIGLAVNLNLVFFYGAPLSKIATVLETKCSKSIHVPTMITSLLNGSLWFFYGLEVQEYFVAVPNGFGALLGVVQLFLCICFPRHHHHPAAGSGGGIVKTSSSQSLSLPEESTPLI